MSLIKNFLVQRGMPDQRRAKRVFNALSIQYSKKYEMIAYPILTRTGYPFIAGFKYRSLKEKRMWSTPGINLSETIPLLWRASDNEKHIILTEGESDLLSVAYHAGDYPINVMCIPGASAWREEFASIFSDALCYTVLADNDEAGGELAKRVKATTLAKVRVCSPGRVYGVKDTAEAFAKGMSFSELLNIISDAETVDAASVIAGGLDRKYKTISKEYYQSSDDLIDLVERCTTLRKSGDSLRGKCPFHDDATSSLMVNAEKQVWYCHACGIGGGVKQWVSRVS